MAAILILLSFQTRAQQPIPADTTQARIDRIQNGLLPSVVLKGQPLPIMKLTDRMQYYHVPGISVTYFDHGQLVWSRSYGVADQQTGRPVTPETLFQAGSISKPIAALGALSLVEKGKLKLDENVNDQLTSWKLPDNEFTISQKVTLRRILSHSSGVSVHGFGGYERTQPVPSVTQILDGTKPANSPPVRVEAVPGSQWNYSGGGTTIMQLMLMEAMGKSFPTLMQELVFGPLGMRHSTYKEPLPLALYRNAAHGYGPRGEPVPGGFRTYPEMAAAGLWTTPTDLALAAIDVQNAYAGASHKLFSQALTKQMLTRQKDTWGLGFNLEKPGATPRFYHFGVSDGFVAVLQAYRDQGPGIVIMTNGRQGEKLINELLRAVAHEYGWPDFQPASRAFITPDPASLQNLAGTYDQADADGQDKFTVTTRNGHLFITGSYSVGTTYHFTISEPIELLAESSQQYFTLQTGETSFRFEKSGQGRVERCIVVSGVNQREAKKVGH
ncbi:serine hydrolase domain-containing protein [Spirosoma arboris]|nr:serine hydrolase domain-containing protein [Spirosoma arboris]